MATTAGLEMMSMMAGALWFRAGKSAESNSGAYNSEITAAKDFRQTLADALQKHSRGARGAYLHDRPESKVNAVLP
jgi:hypothetical protein